MGQCSSNTGRERHSGRIWEQRRNQGLSYFPCVEGNSFCACFLRVFIMRESSTLSNTCSHLLA